ncbi:PulJ/GspJ family protein [Halanaerobacter jeridensis]|uniref:Prepilin-type N-terminal cleavage/methylation domain-containing protein n=1 Tax=Halanaerobacter jeridensis TaxID=706427 RepID=A0A938XS61_9FIRM|nr:prepilin-type N-terminal cleavage/methylation domain-containing protein [Halanaerobacter jeridensis]MBM7555844.1 prepilin-type N-terminal cleavage/methylation domain-containing protein [Halanaerobacter jeridensis]
MNNLNHHNKGYSLIEVLFVVIIFSIIGLGIIQISNFSWNSYTYNKEQSILQRNRTAIQKITKQIRNALNIMINDSGQEIILKTKTANNQFKYYHYLLQNKNLYLQTSNYQPHFKQKKIIYWKILN